MLDEVSVLHKCKMFADEAQDSCHEQHLAFLDAVRYFAVFLAADLVVCSFLSRHGLLAY